MPTITLPEIDLSPLWDDTNKGILKVADQVRTAYTEIGFAYLFNHGIPQETMVKAFSLAKQFHALPLEEKLTIKQNDCFRGYAPINATTLKASTQGTAKKPNQLDSFIMAFDSDINHPDYEPGVYLAGENQWPDALPSLKPGLNQYKTALLKLAKKLVQVFALAMGAEQTALDHLFQQPTYILRLQRYPAQKSTVPDDLYGIAPHTDYGFMTLLAQDTVGGLEVKTTDNQWISAPYKPNSFILNSGDMLRRISNDQFLSTPHRVKNFSHSERYSIPFFFDPCVYNTLEVLESCISPENPRKYPPIKYGDYLLERVQKNYNLGKVNKHDKSTS